ncbi:formate--tetrahydrofolate ligase, partial [Klebsiella pneumoniae]|uniref:formate--tetrahydrofolate ligase n=1 Tax=Klebsiella pneumoniae TaxID=573 RepID=UPI003EE19424
KAFDVQAIMCRHWADGAKGAEELAQAVTRLADQPASLKPLYDADLPLADKIRTVATSIYHAGNVSFADGVEDKLRGFEAAGFGKLPVCMAKT